MKFEFDTRTDTAKDAAALAAALAVLHGPAVAEALEGAATRIESVDMDRFTDALVAGASEGANVPKRFLDPRAVDGLPIQQPLAPLGTEEDDTSAADAFGATAANGPGVALDKDGIPWDERIHASTKTNNKDGTWTRRRNTPDATYDAVMAELKAGATSQSEEANAAEAFSDPTPSEAPAPPATDGYKAPGDTQDNGAQTSSTGPTATTAASPSSTVVPPPPPSTDPITFPKLMVKITKAQTAKTIDPATVLGFLAEYKLSAVKELASAPAATIQAINDMVDAYVGA